MSKLDATGMMPTREWIFMGCLLVERGGHICRPLAMRFTQTSTRAEFLGALISLRVSGLFQVQGE